MTTLEIILIYLACGAPFAVGQLLRTEKYLGLQNVLSSVGSLLGWPILVPGIAKRILSRQAQTKDYFSNGRNLDSRLSEIRKSLESGWCEAFGETKLAAFVDELERYINITLALRRARRISSPEFELTDIASHTDSEAGNACLSRRNKQKLEVHQAVSRTNLAEAIFQLQEIGNPVTLVAAVELADLLGDREFAAELESIRIVPSESSAMAA